MNGKGSTGLLVLTGEVANQDLADQVALQQHIANLIETLVELEKDGMPDIHRHYAFEVSDQQRTIDRTVVMTMPWISFSLCNDGPDPVYVDVNESVNIKEQPYLNEKANKYAPVKSGEELKFGMKRSGIDKLILQCDPGGTANVRVYADAKLRPVEEFPDIVQGELEGGSP